MKCKITLSAQRGVDSKAEIEEELKVIEDIVGAKLGQSSCEAVYECEFHELYLKIKERIMRKLEAYK
ncbi:MAG: hypothetical protein MUO31_13090 [Thermodesulfovibrionales bacterium]|nr:hypothetical protein [Thermodesulfovibrionales bacterium]